jgi:hypothetical protein
MTFFKHVGSVNSKKVIIIQRQLPNEEHMAAVIYSDIMPAKYHDDVMKLLESEEGQHSYEFKDILQRRMMGSGENMLNALANEGYLKKVPAQNVMVTPNSKSSVRLDELNSLLNMAGKGDEAVKKLDALDAKQGMGNGMAPVIEDSPAINVSDMGITPVAPVATGIDQTALMMEMMKTMQSMQQQINNLNGDKPAVKKTTKSKNTASA